MKIKKKDKLKKMRANWEDGKVLREWILELYFAKNFLFASKKKLFY